MNGTDLLITATEGGIDHWATVTTYPAETNGMRYATVTDNYDGTQYRVTAFGMVQGARDVLRMYPNTEGAKCIQQAFTDTDTGYIDAEAADMIFQTIALGCIRYG